MDNLSNNTTVGGKKIVDITNQDDHTHQWNYVYDRGSLSEKDMGFIDGVNGIYAERFHGLTLDDLDERYILEGSGGISVINGNLRVDTVPFDNSVVNKEFTDGFFNNYLSIAIISGQEIIDTAILGGSENKLVISNYNSRLDKDWDESPGEQYKVSIIGDTTVSDNSSNQYTITNYDQFDEYTVYLSDFEHIDIESGVNLGDIVPGTPSLSGTGRGVYADDDYVYIVHNSGNNFTVVDKSNWNEVPTSVSLPGTGRGVYADDDYVYIVHDNGDHFTVVDKSNWNEVPTSISLPSAGYGVYADENYVYIVHAGGNNFTVVDKSNWNEVPTSINLENIGRDVYADDNYVYLVYQLGNGFSVVNKSDWSVVSGTVSLDNTAWGVHADDNYIYIVTRQGLNNGFLKVVDKSDWSVVSETLSLPGNGSDVYADDNYVYIGHTNSPYFTVVDKSNWNEVPTSIGLTGTVFGVYADDNYVYIAHAGGDYITVVEKEISEFDPDVQIQNNVITLEIPNISSPLPETITLNIDHAGTTTSYPITINN